MTERPERRSRDGGAFVGGRWFSAAELRAGAGRRTNDGEAQEDVGICPICQHPRSGATDGPGGSLFLEGSECPTCGHLAEDG